MGFCVKEMLGWSSLKYVRILAGARWLENEIEGVTIIEAPDIVRFINGGEVLLTGLYAFKSCSLEEMGNYVRELEKKKISALIFKRGRDVELAEEKIGLFSEYAERNCIPMIEVPFEVSFKDIMSQIMEQLFSEEVRRLKYFKTTRDNFEALMLSLSTGEDGIAKILHVLGKLIGNPVSVFDQNGNCMGTTDRRIQGWTLGGDAVDFEPAVTSNYRYIRQCVRVDDEETGVNQYIVSLNQIFWMHVYLVVTETKLPLDVMDYIAIESAAAVLQFELSKRFAVMELEKKYQNDILHDILSGRVEAAEELKKSAGLLGLNMDDDYRVIVLGMEYEKGTEPGNINVKLNDMSIFKDSVCRAFPKAIVQNDLDTVIVVRKETEKKEKVRTLVQFGAAKVQEYINEAKRSFSVKAGIGRKAEGLGKLKYSYQEAQDALEYIGVAGEMLGTGGANVILFSDMGVLKLLSQFKSREELMEFMPESLQRLYYYKKSQRDDLLTTLRAYLDRNQNLMKTAQDLHVHYKTVSYRMEKILDLTGMEFDNPGEMLAVRIGLVVCKILDNIDKD